jgi:small-conductance mechanosensitive channel
MVPVLRCLCALAWLALAGVFAGDAAAQPREAMPPFQRSVGEWNRTFEHVGTLVAGPELPQAPAEAFQKQLGEIRDLATAFRDQALAEIESLEQLAEAMGPPPEAGAEPEPPELAAKRKKNAEEIADYKARVAEAELALLRTQELEALLSARLREALLSDLFHQYPLPFMPATVRAAVPELAAHLGALVRSPFVWWARQQEAAREDALARHLTVLVVVLLAALVGWVIRRFLLRRFGRDPVTVEPSYGRRLGAAVAEGVARGIVPALMLGGVLWRITSPEARIDGLFAEALAALALALILVVLAMALPRAALAPYLPAWRLTPIRPEQGRIICRRITILAVVYAVDVFLNRTAPPDASAEMISFYALVSNGIEGGLLLLLVSGGLWRLQPVPEAPAGEALPAAAEAGAPGRPLLGFWFTVRLLIGVAAAAGIVAALVGFSRLSFHLIENLIVSGVIVGVLFLLRGLLRELIGGLTRSRLAVRGLRLGGGARQSIKFWGRAALDLILLVLAVVAIVPSWGVPMADLARWLGQILRGFQIGGVTISLADIAIAIGVFLLGLLLTRIVQRALSERVLPQTRFDVGVQHSLASGLGYVGLVLAAALAISVIGIDLSNIALIAGALSVGIGFGLQNVVNNFVSGLILLVERPVKVGDWVVIGSNEGFIRRINVRATEIETFQRASVIIPNADLLSSAVTNWTHKDRHGRIAVAVGVAYGSDTELVREILLAVAQEHEQVLKWPEPFVLFRDFGASSLDFELRCFTGDVLFRLRIASDLRFAIDARFRETGVEIPFPQRVVHMADAAASAAVPTAADPLRSGADDD